MLMINSLKMIVLQLLLYSIRDLYLMTFLGTLKNIFERCINKISN